MAYGRVFIHYTTLSHESYKMDSRGKLEFPSICRALRLQHGLTQAKVADAIGVKHSSYGNVESANYVVISQKKVEALARLYNLNDNDTLQMIDHWKSLPVHEYTKKNREYWKGENDKRSKAKRHDVVLKALLDCMSVVTGILFYEDWPDDKCARLCVCDKTPGAVGAPCELCNALIVLGLPQGWTNRADVVDKLAAIQASLYPEPLPE